MKLSAVKEVLKNLSEVNFQLANGEAVPAHFHVTEVGMIHKHFIDCGGTIRNEKAVNFQLWYAGDEDHRLSASKLLKIIQLSEEQLQMEDAEVEVEYQAETIGKYNLAFKEGVFLLENKQTACLATDACGNPPEKIKRNLSSLPVQQNTCAPGSGCC